jgi:hypothetical protein
MKRLLPEERRHIAYQTLLRMQKDWTCRYGQWNTAKLLHEFRLLVRKAEKAGGVDKLGPPEPVAAAMDGDLPLFDESAA